MGIISLAAMPAFIRPRYEIKELEGKTYLFFEFKNGDYVFRNMPVCYYVFEKES